MTITLEARPGLVGRWQRPGRHGELVVELDEQTRSDLSDSAMDVLHEQLPEMSAKQTLSREQRIAVAVGAAVAALVALVLSPLLVGRLVCGTLVVVYAAAVFYRLTCFRHGVRDEGLVRVTDADALAATYRQLPVYTVLVPAYREPTVIGALLTHLEALDYPRAKLDVLILLEADDADTLAAVRAATPGSHVRVVVVPESEVTTKPRACNYGLQLARGQIITIYDAEDRPEPLQLRRAAVALARLPRATAGLQARLAYFNADHNVLTRWFTAEYVTWFRHFLPGLVALGAPVPLGGTSNHLRTEVLREVGGWDPYNVTEDCDLGLRLHRLRYDVGVLDSITYEEANSDFINWVKQRSRWYKGYLQTWLVHMRHPVRLRRELGWRGLAGVNLFIGGTPVLALLNPIFWGMTVLWFLGKPHVIEALFSGPIYFLAMICWLLGNFAMVYMGVVSIREAGRPELLASALLVPVYWVMMALAATKAAVQLVRNPSFWEKTVHGLDLEPPDPSAVAVLLPRTPAEGPGVSLVKVAAAPAGVSLVKVPAVPAATLSQGES